MRHNGNKALADPGLEGRGDSRLPTGATMGAFRLEILLRAGGVGMSGAQSGLYIIRELSCSCEKGEKTLRVSFRGPEDRLPSLMTILCPVERPGWAGEG